jgi:hypothetical protein
MTHVRILVAAAIAAAALAASRPAHAFHPPASFDAPASTGGGGGMYFTGAPRDRGYDCTICHVDSEAAIAAEIAWTPAVPGAYEPGAIYQLEVRLAGEHAGFGAATNPNSFMAELVDDAGAAAGLIGNLGTRVRAVGDGTVIGGEPIGGDTWTFAWQAPDAGTGAVTLHLGLVDGDGAGSATTVMTDPNRDDVAVVALRLCESAAGCADRPARPSETSPAGGCDAGGGGAGAGAIAVIVGAAVARRRRRRPALAIAALAACAGCFDPTTPAECADRVCGLDAAPRVDASTCRERWVCSSWEAPPGSDEATRTCVDENQVGTTACKPDEGPVTLPALDLDFYRCRVSPIVQRGCAMMGCHGTDAGRAYRIYARGRLRNDQIVERTGSCIPQTGQVNLQEAGSGTVMCEGWLPHTAEEWKKNFDSARSFMLGVAVPEDSLLLREPVVGGLPHVEVKLFTTADPDYLTIRDWLGGATLAGCTTGAN